MQSLVKLLNVRKKEKYEISLGEKVNQRVSVYGLDPLPSTFPPSPLPFPFVSFLSPFLPLLSFPSFPLPSPLFSPFPLFPCFSAFSFHLLSSLPPPPSLPFSRLFSLYCIGLGYLAIFSNPAVQLFSCKYVTIKLSLSLSLSPIERSSSTSEFVQSLTSKRMLVHASSNVRIW